MYRLCKRAQSIGPKSAVRFSGKPMRKKRQSAGPILERGPALWRSHLFQTQGQAPGAGEAHTLTPKGEVGSIPTPATNPHEGQES
jgi:hypothetical protein